jgi:hypothetical protein
MPGVFQLLIGVDHHCPVGCAALHYVSIKFPGGRSHLVFSIGSIQRDNQKEVGYSVYTILSINLLLCYYFTQTVLLFCYFYTDLNHSGFPNYGSNITPVPHSEHGLRKATVSGFPAFGWMHKVL